MRLRLAFGVVSVAAACLLIAASVIAGPRGTSGGGAVRLVVGRSTFRAGRTVPVTIVNGGPSLILRGFCFTLDRQVGGRWVTVRRTHGVLVPCPTAGEPQAARTRQQLGLALYDDLVPGNYRITLRYKPARGPNLENLTGPHVQSVQARLTVLAFKPRAEPRLSARRILALALRAASQAGDPAPSLIQHAEGTHFDAERVDSGDLVFEWNWSDLIAVRGHFTFRDASVPPGAKPPSGTVLTLVVNANNGQITDSGLGNRYPTLAKLGPVTTDLGPTP